MKKAKKMIYVGKKEILAYISEMKISREAIAGRIGLTKGGLYHVTHRTGRIDYTNWENFKREYKKITGKTISIDESSDPIGLDNYSLEDLLTEIINRGWEVTFSKIKE